MGGRGFQAQPMWAYSSRLKSAFSRLPLMWLHNVSPLCQRINATRYDSWLQICLGIERFANIYIYTYIDKRLSPRRGGTPRAANQPGFGSDAISAVCRCRFGPLLLPLMMPPRWELAQGCPPSPASIWPPLACPPSIKGGRDDNAESRYKRRGCDCAHDSLTHECDLLTGVSWKPSHTSDERQG